MRSTVCVEVIDAEAVLLTHSLRRDVFFRHCETFAVKGVGEKQTADSLAGTAGLSGFIKKRKRKENSAQTFCLIISKAALNSRG